MLLLASERSRADGLIEEIDVYPTTLGGGMKGASERGKQNVKKGAVIPAGEVHRLGGEGKEFREK